MHVGDHHRKRRILRAGAPDHAQRLLTIRGHLAREAVPREVGLREPPARGVIVDIQQANAFQLLYHFDNRFRP